MSIITAVLAVRKYRYEVMRNKSMFATLLETILYYSSEKGLIDRHSHNFKKAVKVSNFKLFAKKYNNDCR